jgi:hypothetical protein
MTPNTGWRPEYSLQTQSSLSGPTSQPGRPSPFGGGPSSPHGGSSYGKPTSQPGRPSPFGGGPSSPHGGSSWEPRGAGGEPLKDYKMFQGPEGELLSGYVGHPIHSAIKAWNERPNDMAMPIGGLTQPQQQQALQGGLGALQGPTQQKIQQNKGAGI